VLIREGALVCASCSAPVALDEPTHSTPPASTTYGSRAPHAAPPGKSHRWLREHGDELRAYGAERRGGKRGPNVVWLLPSEGFERYVADKARAVALAPEESETAPEATNVVDIDGWLSTARYRTTNGAQR